jgi:hypothetical protein
MIVASVLALLVAITVGAGTPRAAAASATGVKPHAVGALDCNGFSPIQRTVKLTGVCADPKGYEGGRFYDNGHYVGHDEPIIRFLSSRKGSGSATTWRETLPRDPRALPTVAHPGSDVTHWFELSVAPWFSMALCNPKSYPLQPCTPESDANAPRGSFPGGGGSFLEMQFYPPGFAPFVDSISCDNTHWCASLHINDLECEAGFEDCNPNCIEPTNFAFIQANGVPTGPPSPQLANLATFTPNAKTLLMNPGDQIVARIFNADLGRGRHALETRIDDLTTGRSGFMIASAANGFMATSIEDCSGTPFDYQPEYDTAAPANVIPWAALQTNISTDFEIGHFTPCTAIHDPATFTFEGFSDTFWQECSGPYERAGRGGLGEEPSDAPCFFRGDTHGGTAPPNQVTGCANFDGGGDLDFDGTSYWPDWPDKVRPDRYPSPFLQRQPLTRGSLYSHMQFQTEVGASEATCQPTGEGCAVPPPGAPGHFYPYWTLARVNGVCGWEFGQMSNGRSFGKDRQYGKPALDWFFATLESPIMPLPHC